MAGPEHRLRSRLPDIRRYVTILITLTDVTIWLPSKIIQANVETPDPALRAGLLSAVPAMPGL